MANWYIERIVRVVCRGRTWTGEPALAEPVEANVRLGRDMGWSMPACCCYVSCPHNTGGNGQGCGASHPSSDKEGEGVLCPFAFDYPYALKSIGWKMPEELREAVEAVMLGKGE